MCNIVITGYTAIPISATQTQFTITGTATGSPLCTEVRVCVGCGGSSVCVNVPVATSGNWTATIVSNCLCGTPFNITVTCIAGGPCSQTFSGTVNCDCCPTAVITPTIGKCDLVTGMVPVSFSIAVTVPPQCGSATVKMDFGNGSFGTLQTFGSGTNTYVDSSVYLSNSVYTPCLTVSFPTGCPSICISLPIPACNCCPTVSNVSASAPAPCVSGKSAVTFTATVTPSPNCTGTVKVQWNFGDGNLSPIISIPVATTFSETNNYLPSGSPYTACLNIIEPTGCPPTCLNISIPPCDCCPTVTLSILPPGPGPCVNGYRAVTIQAVITIPAGCPGVQVQWDYGDGSFGIIQSIGSSTTISTVHQYLANGTPYICCLGIIPNSCNPPCININLQPCPVSCCPGISGLTYSTGSCNIVGHRQMTLNATITPNTTPGCPPTEVQWNYGDGSFGPVHVISGPTTISDSHYYNPSGSPFNACLDVISPGGCPPLCMSVSVPSCPAFNCNIFPFNIICILWEILFLPFAIFTFIFLFAALCEGPPFVALFIVSLIVALILLFLILRYCIACLPCGWLNLNIGRSLIIADIAICAFIACCPGLWFTFFSLYLILGLIFLMAWQTQCNISRCKFWYEFLYDTLAGIAIGIGLVFLFRFLFPCMFPGGLIAVISFGVLYLIIAIIAIINNC